MYDYSVTVETPEEANFVCDLAKIAGLTFGEYLRSGTYKSLPVDWAEKHVAGNSRFWGEGYRFGPECSIGQFMKDIQERMTAKKRPVIKAGEYTVEFKDNGVQVGCTFVPTETVNAIYKELNEQK